jgi:nucleoside-diphosphate-sugar epimerase
MIKLEIFGCGFLAQEILRYFSANYPNLFVYLSPRSFLYAHSNSRDFQVEQIKEFSSRSPDFLINAAGPTSIPDSFLHPEIYLEVPSSITRFLIDASGYIENEVTILQISTASVYGDCTDEIATEDTQLNPLSPYALGKARADDYLAESTSKWSILRATSIYSNSLDQRVLGRLRSGLINSEKVTLGGTGYELRDFMHANDLSRALFTLVENKKSIHNIFLIGTGTSLQLNQVAEIAMSSSANKGLGFSVEFDLSTRQGDPFAMIVDISKSKMFNFNPLVAPLDGLRQYFEASI